MPEADKVATAAEQIYFFGDLSPSDGQGLLSGTSSVCGTKPAARALSRPSPNQAVGGTCASCVVVPETAPYRPFPMGLGFLGSLVTDDDTGWEAR